MKNDLQPGEFLQDIVVPLPAAGQRLRAYKVSKRFDSDISAVCGAFSVVLDGERVTEARFAFGGMAATVKRAARAEAAALGQRWDDATAQATIAALADDFTPLTDLRASADYRRAVAGQLLRRFAMETRVDAPLAPAQLNVWHGVRLATA